MRAHHRLTVQLRTRQEGSAGQSEYIPSGEPIEVRGNIHPLSQEEIQLWGDSARETIKWFCKTWPGDIHSEVTLRDAKWDQVAPAAVFDLGKTTKHVEVVLRRR
jgi:hypothetical protein